MEQKKLFNAVMFDECVLYLWPEMTTFGQFIGCPQSFVELQLHFKLHFPSVKMQFET